MLINFKDKASGNGPHWSLWIVLLVFTLMCLGTFALNLLKIEGY